MCALGEVRARKQTCLHKNGKGLRAIVRVCAFWWAYERGISSARASAGALKRVCVCARV